MVYERRKLWKAPRHRDIDVGRGQVARLMHQLGIQGAAGAKKRFTTKSDPTMCGGGSGEPGFHRQQTRRHSLDHSSDLWRDDSDLVNRGGESLTAL